MVSNANGYNLSWKSKGLSDIINKPPSTSTNILTPLLNYQTIENCLSGAVKLTKILILISTNILDMVLDLVEKDFFTW